MPGINIKQMRESNISLVLDIVRQRSPISRREISRLTHLSPSTVSSIVDKLIAAGFITESPASAAKVSRRPVYLRLNPQMHFPLGIEIETHQLLGLVMNLCGDILHHETIPLPETDYPGVLCRVVELYQRLVQEMPGASILGVGIASPGYVDSQKGTVVFSSNLGWRDVPVLDVVSKQIDTPVFVQSNIQAVALGELWYGAGVGREDLICVRVGSGIGAGIIIGGEIYRGPQDRAGHFGHMIIERGGRRCRCGNLGCLEAYVSTSALLQQVERGLTANADTQVVLLSTSRNEKLDAIIQAGKEGDRFVLNIFEEMGNYLGIGLTNLVNLLNPELIIIAGGMAKAGDLLLEPLRRALALHAYPPLPEVTTTRLGEYTVAVGAATRVIQHVFENPIRRANGE